MKSSLLLIAGVLCFLPVCMNLEGHVLTQKKVEVDVLRGPVEMKDSGENPKGDHVGENKGDSLQVEEHNEPVLAGNVKLDDIDKDIPAANSNARFLHGFAAAISVIIVSEIGDKTFFIAAIMAMRHSRWLVFGGAITALALMTVLSVCLGFATMIIPRFVTFYISTALLALFGCKMLYDGYKMDPNEGQEELEEVTQELQKREESLTQGSGDVEQGLSSSVPLRRRLWFLGPMVSPIFLQSLTLTFLAEWGDRSQLTTIILGARENALGVILGGTLGHALCTALAVIGGKMVAQRISVKTVTLIGGVVFLVFAVTAFFHANDQS